MKRRSFRFGQGRRSCGRPKPKKRHSLVLIISIFGYGKIEFCRHALDRMNQRGISREEVIEAINDPTSTGHPAVGGRSHIRKEFPKTGRVIDVVYDELSDRVRVITTYEKN